MYLSYLRPLSGPFVITIIGSAAADLAGDSFSSSKQQRG
jgi:hypothetical protein